MDGDDAELTYLLQVYDARSRLLLGTATAQSADNLHIDDLPAEASGNTQLLLFVRTMVRSSTSDATILYVGEAGTGSNGPNSHHRRAGNVGGKPSAIRCSEFSIPNSEIRIHTHIRYATTFPFISLLILIKCTYIL